MKQLTRRKQIVIYRNTDNKKAIVDTIEEAMAVTGCTENYIRMSCKKANHYSNRSDDWQPTTFRGTIRKQTIKPLYRFEYVEPVLIVARPAFDADIKEHHFKSYFKAIKTIGCAESTFYKHKKLKIKHIVDKQKRVWILEWMENSNGNDKVN
jgi:hypothetical protein